MLAARLLGLKLTDARQAGYDAVGSVGRRVQIKSRCILPNAKPGQRLGSIRLDHEWDTIAIILLDQYFEPLEIYEAVRSAVEREPAAPGVEVTKRTRGAQCKQVQKAIGELRWPSDEEKPA